MKSDADELPPFPRIADEPWAFGQPTEAGDYEWWSPIHSLRVNATTVYVGYCGEIRQWGRDTWYRKIPAVSEWELRMFDRVIPNRIIATSDGVICGVGRLCSPFVVQDGIVTSEIVNYGATVRYGAKFSEVVACLYEPFFWQREAILVRVK